MKNFKFISALLLVVLLGSITYAQENSPTQGVYNYYPEWIKGEYSSLDDIEQAYGILPEDKIFLDSAASGMMNAFDKFVRGEMPYNDFINYGASVHSSYPGNISDGYHKGMSQYLRKSFIKSKHPASVLGIGYSYTGNDIRFFFSEEFELEGTKRRVPEDLYNAAQFVKKSISQAKLKDGSLSEFEKVRRVHDIMVLSYEYDKTLKKYYPNEMIMTGEGVCQAYTLLFDLYMRELGIESGVIWGTFNGGGHTWNTVKLNGQWYNVDVTHDDPIWTGAPRPMTVVYNCFLVSDSNPEFSKGRVRDINSPGECFSDYPGVSRDMRNYTEKEKVGLLNGEGLEEEKISLELIKKILNGEEIEGREGTYEPMHVWTVTLNDTVSEEQLVKGKIFMFDKDGRFFPVSLSFGNNKREIKIIPLKPYEQGNFYYVVLMNLKSVSDKKMTKIFWKKVWYDPNIK